MPTTQALPTHIDGVIERLEAIIKESIARKSRLGYFAALYNRVTERVREGIRKGEFQDGARMERLDVIFANRYIEAYDQFRSGQRPSTSWLKAFKAAEDKDKIVLQHLLVGMNAHINLDLGIAAARTCPGAELPPLQGDFNRINQVLAELTPIIEQEIDNLSPLFKLATSIAPKLELKVVGFSMDKARTEAWSFATALAPLSLMRQASMIGRRDGETSIIADVVLNEGLIVRAIRAVEKQDVARNIEELAAGEFRIRIAPTIHHPH